MLLEEAVLTAPPVVGTQKTSRYGEFMEYMKNLSIGIIVTEMAILYGLGVQYMCDTSAINRMQARQTEYHQSR